MKYIILGQPKSGKSTLANIISKKLNIPIICTDKYRREWGFHEPQKGYDTEISNEKQKLFYDKLLKLYNSYDNVILEGSTINPKNVELFNNNGVVLLYRNLNNLEMLNESRKYDSDWTSKRTDEYLLNLFNDYINYSKKWIRENPDIAVDTTNFYEGLQNAKEKLLKYNY